MAKAVILIGGGGHARVLLDILQAQDVKLIGYTDVKAAPQFETAINLELLGDDEVILNYPADQVELVNGLGSLPGNNLRQKIFQRFTKKGYSFRTLVHPSAIVAKNVVLNDGVQVMAGVVIQTGSVIGANVIINTRASVDHDCHIAEHCHVAPGAVLSGGVKLGDGVHIGTGATLIQGVSIGCQVVVGAGAVVAKSVATHSIVYPARSVVQCLDEDFS